CDIFADGIRMTQVLVNLLSNALKFSPEKSSIVVEASKTEREIIIKVIDQGPGMSSEQASKLFQRFSQLEGHIQQGSGLGLAICKALVDLHQGQIGVDSDLTKGSTFWIKLPANQPSSE
ncbi:MAG: ATP-binding protein, partial [Candidatus Obscuribacterales bacterium]|nr:ATP-binding protein [Candidatus Obscuribacterales bacterium]